MTAKALTAQLLGLNLITPGSQVALGVSGGGDSVAMLHMVADWAASRSVQLHVFTVDHKLRAESGDEAHFVAKICKRLGLPHETLIWDRPKASQNAARTARHKLLAKAARRVGAKHLLLGHTLNDVIETHEMRKSRGGNSEKEIGPMPASVSPVWPEGRGLLILRPLLLMLRKDLRTWLEAMSITWIDDPTNENETYERPRIRKRLSSDKTDRAKETVLSLQARSRAEVSLAPLLRQCAERCDAFGLIRIPVTTDESHLTDLIPFFVPAAAGSDRIPKAYVRLKAMFELQDPNMSRYTLGGAWLQRSGLDILIGRAPVKHELKLEDQVFDGRFEPSTLSALPDEVAPFLVRHALPEGQNWSSLIPQRLETQAAAFEANAELLTRPRASVPS